MTSTRLNQNRELDKYKTRAKQEAGQVQDYQNKELDKYRTKQNQRRLTSTRQSKTRSLTSTRLNQNREQDKYKTKPNMLDKYKTKAKQGCWTSARCCACVTCRDSQPPCVTAVTDARPPVSWPGHFLGNRSHTAGNCALHTGNDTCTSHFVILKLVRHFCSVEEEKIVQNVI